MVNVGVILLITLAIVLTIAMIILIVWAAISYSQNATSGNTGTIELPPCSGNTGDLIQIPINTPRCMQNGQVTSMYYIGQISPQTYDYVVVVLNTICYN